MATESEIQKIIDATDIVKLVSNYVDLKKSGKIYKGLCPFHSEDTPSFVVSPEKNIAKCFGCGVGGNPITFIEKIENVDFITALEKLAKFNGIPFNSNKQFKENTNTKYYKIMDIAVNFYKKYYENSTDGIKAKEYLYKRGLNDDVIKDFNVGLSPTPGNTLYQVLNECDVLEYDMLDVGLVDKNDKGYYDLFSSRIMFPIYNEEGNPVGFSARIFDSSDKNQAKYVNSRDTRIFKKGSLIFNLNNAKGYMQKNKRIILHEGQMDVIASYRSGFKEAICTLGTALTIDQAKLLQRYANKVIICYDGDKAGINASLKAINIFSSLRFDIKLVLLPNGMDPDEYVLKYGCKKYVEYFNSNLLDILEYKFMVYTFNKNLNDINDIISIENNCFSLIVTIQSLVVQDEYLNKLSKILNIPFDSIKGDFTNFRGNVLYEDNQKYNDNYDYNDTYIDSTNYPREIKKHYKQYELRLFGYARANKNTALYIDSKLSDRMESMSLEGQDLWIRLINSFYSINETFDEGLFLKSLSQSEAEFYFNILELLRKDMNPYTDEDLELCLSKLKEDTYKIKNQNLSREVIKTDDVSKKARLLDEMFKNKKNQNQISKTRRK